MYIPQTKNTNVGLHFPLYTYSLAQSKSIMINDKRLKQPRDNSMYVYITQWL
jgi:hypothetical protein